jgi:predicted dinucleotide-binding enzyme
VDHSALGVWQVENGGVGLSIFAEAAAYGEMILNCTAGVASPEALGEAVGGNLNSKVLVDVSNPIDFSQGMPPAPPVCSTDSLGEQIQRVFSELKVVKMLNTVTARPMADPGLVADGDHPVFDSGNGKQAKAQVAKLLESLGWQEIVDLGGIGTARGLETWLSLWLELLEAKHPPAFGLKAVR